VARGRPVGVVVDGQGALLVADDVGNAIWRVTPTTPKPVAMPAPAEVPGETGPIAAPPSG
jgi:streptogramin lyase